MKKEQLNPAFWFNKGTEYRIQDRIEPLRKTKLKRVGSIALGCGIVIAGLGLPAYYLIKSDERKDSLKIFCSLLENGYSRNEINKALFDETKEILSKYPVIRN